jgi:mono/diheme cytochrome c family protein
MTRRVAIPLAAGLAVAAIAFVVVLLATRAGDEPASAPSRATPGPGSTNIAGGRLVFAQMGCGSCHTLAAAGATGEIGPSLDAALPRITREAIQAKIVSPGQGSVMPPDFAQRMNFADLKALVDFLIAARGSDDTMS